MPPTSRSSIARFSFALISIVVLALLGGLLVYLEKPTGSLKARIVGEDGQPLPRLKVDVDFYPYNEKITTDAAGGFELNNLALGKYYLNLRAKGYQANYLRDQFEIQEGQTRDLGPLALKELEPNLYVELWNDTKTPDEKITLTLSGAKVRSVQLTAYRVNLQEFLQEGQSISKMEEQNFDPAASKAFEKVQEWTETIPEADVPEFNRRATLPLEGKGAFLIRALASSTDRQKVFNVNKLVNKTDLGFAIKRDKQKILIFASSFLKPQVVSGAQGLLIMPGQEAQAFTTNEQGLAEIPVPEAGDGGSELVLLSYQGSVAFQYVPATVQGEEGAVEAEEGEGEGETGGLYKVFIYTERPLYRPGQKVYFKGMVRQETAVGGYVIPASEPVEIRVDTPKGDILYETTLTPNAMGSFWAEFDLEEEGEIGYYNIVATYRGGEHQQDFQVDEYRKPEFKVEIKPDKPRYFSGDEVTFLIDTQYYFGAPLETEVEYTIYKSPYYYSAPGEVDYHFEHYGEEDSGYGGYGEVLSEGKVKTDANGRAVVKIKAPKSGEDVRLTLRATAQDLTERIVTSENDAFVVGGDFYFRTKVTQYFAKAGAPYPLTVVTRDYDGKPVKVDFRLDVERERWDSMTSEYRYSKVQTLKGETAENGVGELQVTVKEGGYYRLSLSGKDSAGRKVIFRDYLWVSGSRDDSEGFELQQNLVVVAEKKKYEAGQTVQLFVAGPVKDSKFLVTVEGPRILEYRVEALDGFSKLVSIELKKEWIPNVFIGVSAIGTKEYFTESTEISINPSENYLQVAIEPSQKSYQPGNDISYRILTKDSAGNPVPAEVSLGVVDESLYALRADSTNIKEFFWGPRPNRVGSNYSFSGYYSGGIEKEDQKLLRRNFKDTAYWVPSVMTNDQGEATVQFKLPDNLTTWRATAIAANAETDVGQEIDKVISSKPLITRISVPRFFTERDEATLKVLVQNYTETPQTLKVSLGLTGLQFKDGKDEAPRSVTVDSKKTASFSFPVLAKTPGEAKVQVMAKNDAVSDGFELKIPVLPHGIEDHQYAQGEIPGGAEGSSKAAVALNLPAQTNLPSVMLKVTLDTTLVAQLLDSLAYLVGYPYGCVEQTTSRLLSSITVAHLYETLSIKDESLEKKIPKIVSQSLKRLAGMQHEDGGWGWWKNDETHPFMTAYAMYGLLRVKELGFKLNEEMLTKGKQSLEAQIKAGFSVKYYPYGPVEDTQYFVYYVAGLAGLHILPPLPASHQLKTNLAQSYLILALAAQGKHDLIEPWLTHLERAARCERNLCHFSDDANTSRRGDPEVTAWTLRALIAGGSTNATLQKDVVAWLLAVRKGGIWLQTQQTAAVIYAISEYAKSQPGGAAGVKAALWLNGKELEKINVAAAHFVRRLKNPAVQVGKNDFDIYNSLTDSLFYQTDLAYFSQEEDLKAVDQGIQLSREYFRLKMKVDPSSGERSYEAKPLQGKIALGETIGVRLTLQTSKILNFLVIEDALPSGFEVMKDISFDKDVEYTSETEVHDEKMALFRSYLEPGKQIFNYAIRPEIPGLFHVMPAVSYEMYDPPVRGSSDESRLQVE